MVNTAIRQVIRSLDDVSEHFRLVRAEDAEFFQEWYGELPALSDFECRELDILRDRFDYHWRAGNVDEGTVNILIVSRLLELAGLYDPPFRVRSEVSVEVESAKQSELLRGRIDFLVVRDRFWRAVIESKETTFDASVGIPQTLAYMVGARSPSPVFGLVTNGLGFVFLKVFDGAFDRSDTFAPQSRGNHLYAVLQILKRIAEAI